MLVPDRVKVPLPSLVKVPEPVPIMPFDVTLPAPPNVMFLLVAVIVAALLKVSVPLSELIRESVTKVMAP